MCFGAEASHYLTEIQQKFYKKWQNSTKILQKMAKFTKNLTKVGQKFEKN